MKMRFIFILFLFIFSQQAHSCDSNDTIIIYKKQWTDSKGSWEDRYWQYDACVPSGCYIINDMKKNPNKYKIKNIEKLSSLARSCKFHSAGKSIKDNLSSGISKGKKFLEDSAAGSFLKGLLGK